MEIKGIFAEKVRFYLEIRVLERLSVSMFPFRNSKERRYVSHLKGNANVLACLDFPFHSVMK